MPPLIVDNLAFDFPATVAAQKYDTWTHWATQSGKKKVDVVALEPASAPNTTWLIEAKDFRVITSPPKSTNIGTLHETVAQKMHDSLLGLAHAAAHAHVATEKAHAVVAIATPRRRVVLHLEPHPATGTQTALFPANFTVSVYQALKILVAGIDPNPLVLNIANTPRAGVPWSVS